MLASLLIASTLKDSEYVEAAKRAAIWIEAERKRGPNPSRALYSGTSGELLFFLELHHATGDKRAKEQAIAIADDLAAKWSREEDAGLYTGLSGVAFSLNEAGKVLKEGKYREASKQAFAKVVALARESRWNESNDIISGSAGIGLALLYAAEQHREERFKSAATKAASELISRADKVGSGLSWKMTPTFARTMPNFSHGTAGVGFFLKRAHQATGNSEFKNAADAAAQHLLAIASKNGLIYHNDPDGKDLYYLGWCHGPAGTSRFFALQGTTAGADWIRKAEEALASTGAPQMRSPGFWNNHGLCCGDAGLVMHFIEQTSKGRTNRLAQAERFAKFILSKAEPSDNGLKWSFAEHRVRPSETSAQTGLMQGASGIGLALLWLDGAKSGRKPAIRLPDAL